MSLDPDTERKVLERMLTSHAGACVVSSLHRLNLLDRFDELPLGRHDFAGNPTALLAGFMRVLGDDNKVLAKYRDLLLGGEVAALLCSGHGGPRWVWG